MVTSIMLLHIPPQNQVKASCSNNIHVIFFVILMIIKKNNQHQETTSNLACLSTWALTQLCHKSCVRAKKKFINLCSHFIKTVKKRFYSYFSLGVLCICIMELTQCGDIFYLKNINKKNFWTRINVFNIL